MPRPRNVSLQTDQLLDHLFYVLAPNGAGSQDEIAERLSGRIGEVVTQPMVADLLHLLRNSPPEKYGWSVPSVKRGPYEPGRYAIVIIGGSDKSKVDKPMRRYIHNGNQGSFSYSKTLMNTLQQMLRHMIECGKPAVRREATGLAMDIQFLATKLAHLEETCRQADAA